MTKRLVRRKDIPARWPTLEREPRKQHTPEQFIAERLPLFARSGVIDYDAKGRRITP